MAPNWQENDTLRTPARRSGLGRAGSAWLLVLAAFTLPLCAQEKPSNPAGDSGLAVLGRLVGPSGEAVVGAEVRLGPASDGLGAMETIRTTSDVEGRFRFADLDDGERILTVLPAPGSGWAGLRQAVQVQASSDDVRTIDLGVLALEAGHSLRGRVVDARGEGVAGAELELIDDVFEDWQGAATSTEDGSFRLLTQATGAVLLRTRADGHPPRTLELEVPAGGLSGLRIELETGFGVAGRVVASTGAPVAGAWVGPVGSSGEGEEAVDGTFTGTDGTFYFDAVSPNTHALVVRVGGRPEHRHDLAWADPPTALEDLRIELPAGTTLVGRIVGLSRDELGEVELEAVQASRDRIVRAEDRPRADGSFRLDGLGPGIWRLNARLDSGSGARGEERRTTSEIAILPDQPEVRIELRFEPGEPFAGTILVHGEPAEGLELTAVAIAGSTWRTASTRADGRFRFESLEAGEWLLRITDPERGFAHAVAIATPSPAEALLDLVPVAIEGRIVDAEGAPLAGARLRLRPPGEAGAVVHSVGTSRADGRFRLWATFQGTAELEIRHGEHTLTQSLDIPDTGLADLDLRVD